MEFNEQSHENFFVQDFPNQPDSHRQKEIKSLDEHFLDIETNLFHKNPNESNKFSMNSSVDLHKQNTNYIFSHNLSTINMSIVHHYHPSIKPRS